MNNIEVYNTYSKYLKDKYGEKVYKLPVKLDLTCPNRDGSLGVGGCIYCGEEGGSFENLSSKLNIREQLRSNKEYIGTRYKAKKFIAYFQNFTNTYMDLDQFKSIIGQAIDEDIVGIAISTRPDCVNDTYLEYLSEVAREHKLEITMELGLQTVNYKTLEIINRGHGLAEYIDASIRLKKYGIRNCTHLILNLPWDSMEDVLENAKILSSLEVEEVKLHSLYIVKNTRLGKMYENKEFDLISKEEYIDRVILFLRTLSKDTVVQRLLGRAPEDLVLFENWGESWWKIRDEIVLKMEENNYRQGDLCDYLNGKGLRKFL